MTDSGLNITPSTSNFDHGMELASHMDTDFDGWTVKELDLLRDLQSGEYRSYFGEMRKMLPRPFDYWDRQDKVCDYTCIDSVAEVEENPSKRSRTETDVFRSPPARLTAKKPISILSNKNVHLGNRFHHLSETNLDNNAVNAFPTENNPSQLASTPTELKIKPITMKRTDNYREIMEAIAVSEIKFHARVGGEFVRLYPNTSEDHRKLTTFLREREIEGFILPIGIVKNLKVVLRGIPTDISDSEIAEELEKLDFPVLKVARLIKRKTKEPMPLVQVQLTPGDKANEIFKMDEIFHIRIKVVEYVNYFKVQQCHRCQNFHHHSNNCLMKPRCVKCAGTHITSECTEGQGKIDNVRCCNCGGSHPASYQGCEKFPKPKPNNVINNSNRVTAGRTYASALSDGGNRNDAVGPAPRVRAPIQMTSNIPTRAQPSQSATRHEPLSTSIAAELDDIASITNEIKSMLNVNNFNELLQELKTIRDNMARCTDNRSMLFVFLEGISQSATVNQHGR